MLRYEQQPLERGCISGISHFKLIAVSSKEKKHPKLSPGSGFEARKGCKREQWEVKRVDIFTVIFYSAI